MDDANVRKAFALAVDKDRLIDLLSSNLELRADTILPPAKNCDQLQRT
jgi:ABC-type oligopeptide transport system substrate-binding subunit